MHFRANTAKTATASTPEARAAVFARVVSIQIGALIALLILLRLSA
jgi:hypothetical protein